MTEVSKSKEINQEKAILDSVPVGIVEIDPAGKILYSNPAYRQLMGAAGELVGTSILDGIEAVDERKSLRYLLAMMTHDQPAPCSITRRTSAGGTLELQVDWTCRRNDAHELTSIVVIFSDVTESKQTQHESTKILANARRAERLVKLGTYEWDWDKNRLLACSEEYARIHEMSVDQALRYFNSEAADLAYIHPDDRERIEIVTNEALSRDKGFSAEYRMQLPSGRIRYIQEICEAILNAEGRVVSTAGTLQDVTEFKRVHEQLSKSLANAQQAQQLVGLGTYEWDEVEDRLVGCSEEYARIFEMSVDEALRIFDNSQVDLEYVHPDDREAANAVDAEAQASGEHSSVQYRMVFPDGRIVHIREVFCYVKNEYGELVRSFGSLQDVTQHALLEAQLQQAQKMEAVGQLAGGIAHEFNNLLMVIKGYNDAMLQGFEEDDSWRHNLDQIKIASDRAAGLTGQILAFGRKQMLQPKIINLAEIASGLGHMLQRLLGDQVHLEIRPASDLKPVRADPGQIQQVIMNLLINAGDAMPKGGNITLTFDNLSLGARDRFGPGQLQAGDYAVLVVTDDGIGMTEETRSHIFEPFFTTKEIGKGSGLGLSTVFGIIKQSGGDIEVESAPNQGSTFRVYLPQFEGEEPVVSANRISSPVDSRGGETILLVEDDGLIRKMLENNLQRLGYTVLVARNGTDALGVSEDHDEIIDLMLTDVVMPEMGGHELARELATTRPGMSVVYMSGYDEKTVTDYGPVENRFLQKPFDAWDVDEKIREVLGGIAS